jgi:H+/Cl- antiporter ClcA
MPNPHITPTIHYILHAVLGGCLGFLSALIFWIFYLFQTYDQSVPDNLRYHAAFWDTALVIGAILVVFYYKPILAAAREFMSTELDDEGDDE